MRRKQNETTPRITALYERLSREDSGAGDSISIQNQKIKLECYAAEHGFANAVHYTDDGYSGASFQRPAWNQLMEDIKARRIGTVIVKDLDSDPDRTTLAEYMVGNVHGKLPGQKGWSGSRGLAQPVLSEPEEIQSVDELAPPPGAVIKDVREIQDEDGLVIGKYIRYVLPVAPRLRGGQIIMPRAPKRGGHRYAAD